MTTLVVSIRRARTEDAPSLSRIFDGAWREAYQGIIPGVALERMMARRGPRWWHSTIARSRPLAVLDIGDTLAGYVSYGRCRDRQIPAEGEVDELYLAPEYQGLGFGRRLFRAARNDLVARGLPRTVVWALADNERACSFYEGLGGEAIARTNEKIGGTPLGKIAYVFKS